MIKVAIVDDHSQIRAQVRKILEKSSDIEVVAEAQDGLECICMLEQCHPDVIVLDVEMPGMSGLEVLAKIRDASIPVRVIMLSGYSDKVYIHEALNLGAKAFIVKEDAWHILVQVVKSIGTNTEDKYLSRMARLATET